MLPRKELEWSNSLPEVTHFIESSGKSSIQSVSQNHTLNHHANLCSVGKLPKCYFLGIEIKNRLFKYFEHRETFMSEIGDEGLVYRILNPMNRP